MLSSIRNHLKNQKSLKKRVFSIVGITISLLLGSVGAFFIYSNWSHSRTYLIRLNTEDAQVEATDIKLRLYRAIGVARTMSMAADFMLKDQVQGKDSLLESMLNNWGQRLSRYNDIILYQSAYYAFDEQYLPGSTAAGRTIFLATNDKPGVYKFSKPTIGQTDTEKSILAAEQSQKATASLPHSSSYENGGATAYVASVSAPITYNGKVVGAAGVDIPLAQIQNIVKSMDLVEGASASLIAPNGDVVANTDASLIGKKSPIEQESVKEAIASYHTSTSKEKALIVEDDGKTFFIVPVAVDQANTNWALCVAVPDSKLYASVINDTLIGIIVMVLGIGLCLYLSNQLSQKLTEPINRINDSIKQLAKGEILNSQKLVIDSKTEIGEIANSVNQVIEGLGKTMSFATEIGTGNFNADYKLLSENDDLGHSLLDMKSSLQKAKELEQIRQEEEKLNNWANEGVAKFAEILRSNHSNIKELSFQVISNLVKYLNVNQGGIFIQDDQDKHMLNMSACFAYNRRKLLEQQVEVGEGLVGRCFVEAETIYLLEVPSDYIRITSGLGDAPPRNLVLVPLKVNNEVNGVLELASIEPINEFKVKFIEKVAESIASTLNSVRINERTSRLLEQTKLQAEEMAAAEEEMRQNLEELQSTQEEMARINEENKHNSKRLEMESGMFHMLISNSSDYIFFKDTNGRFTKLNDSVLEMFGLSSESEAIGKTVYDFYPPEIAQKLEEEEQHIINTKTPIVNKEIGVTFKNGASVNMILTKRPITDSNGDVIGLYGVYKLPKDKDLFNIKNVKTQR